MLIRGEQGSQRDKFDSIPERFFMFVVIVQVLVDGIDIQYRTLKAH